MVQYANKSTEKHLGLQQDEIIGTFLQNDILGDHLQLSAMNSSLINSREWQGQIVLKRRAQEPVTALCKTVPVAFGR